jgi:NADPH2:quinone reductase
VIVNYRTDDVAQRCLELTAGIGVDRIVELDLAANLKTDMSALRRDGEITAYGSGLPEIPVPFFPAILKNARLQFFIVYNLSDADRKSGLAGVTALLAQERLKHNVSERLPLARIAEAHELVEGGRTLGNVVIAIA